MQMHSPAARSLVEPTLTWTWLTFYFLSFSPLAQSDTLFARLTFPSICQSKPKILSLVNFVKRVSTYVRYLLLSTNQATNKPDPIQDCSASFLKEIYGPQAS